MKLTTKLVLGATIVAGLSISTFAVCASDVDFGGTKKITGLADGTTTGEAVTYDQVMAISSQLLTFDSESNTTGSLTLMKVGRLCSINGDMVFSTTETGGNTIANAPENYRPTGTVYGLLIAPRQNSHADYEGTEFRIDAGGIIRTWSQVSGRYLANLTYICQ